MKKLWAVCAFASCAVSALPALAEGFYVAGDLGRVRWVGDATSARDSAFSLAGGYLFDLPFRDKLALEVGYRNLGSLAWDNGLAVNNVELSAVQFSVLANHSVNDRVSFYGRVGYADVNISATASASSTAGFNSASTFNSASNSTLFGAIGARYALTSSLGAYLEYDKYEKIGAVKLSGVLLGLDYRF